MQNRNEKSQYENWLIEDQKKQHRLNTNHNKIKKYIESGMSLKRLREIYGAWAVNEVLNYHE